MGNQPVGRLQYITVFRQFRDSPCRCTRWKMTPSPLSLSPPFSHLPTQPVPIRASQCYSTRFRVLRYTLSGVTLQAPGSTVGQPCGSLSVGNIRRIFGGIFEMRCAEWYTSVDSRRLSTVELKSKAFLAVDSGACEVTRGH